MERPNARTVTWTALALTAFAANSLLCRRALGHTALDAASFSTIRLAAGAAVLWAIVQSRGRVAAGARGSWGSAALLFLYAVPFSFAYVRLSAGTGALVLFGAVQTTMLAAALVSGERPHAFQWTGLLLALGGLVYLVMPGLTAPSRTGCALMAVAGASWGFYSLSGRRAAEPLAETAGNFARAVPMALGISLLAASHAGWSTEGAVLAVLSGALASGLGYLAWFAALPGLTATRAASVQLAVPVLAAAGGVIVLAEPVTLRLVLSGALILGGVALVIARTGPRRPQQHPRAGSTGAEAAPRSEG